MLRCFIILRMQFNSPHYYRTAIKWIDHYWEAVKPYKDTKTNRVSDRYAARTDTQSSTLFQS